MAILWALRNQIKLKYNPAILCPIPRTTVTSQSATKEIRCKTHPLSVNPGILF